MPNTSTLQLTKNMNNRHSPIATFFLTITFFLRFDFDPIRTTLNTIRTSPRTVGSKIVYTTTEQQAQALKMKKIRYLHGNKPMTSLLPSPLAASIITM